MKTHGFRKFTAMLSAIAMTASCFAAFAVPAGAAGEYEASTTVTQNATAAVLAKDNDKIKEVTATATAEPTGISKQIRMTAAQSQDGAELEDLGAAIGVFKLGQVKTGSQVTVKARLYAGATDLSGVGLYTTGTEVQSDTGADGYKTVMQGTALSAFGAFEIKGSTHYTIINDIQLNRTDFSGTVKGGTNGVTLDSEHLAEITYTAKISSDGYLYFLAGAWQNSATGTASNRQVQVVDISVEYSDTLENTVKTYAPAGGTVNVLNDVNNLTSRLNIEKNLTVSAGERKTITRDGTQGIIFTTAGSGLTLDNVNVTATSGTDDTSKDKYAVAVAGGRTLTIKNATITGDIYQENGNNNAVNLEDVRVNGTVKTRKALQSDASSTTCKINLTGTTHADAVKYYYNNDTLTMDAESSIGTLTIYGEPAADDVVVKAADGATLDPTKITKIETPNVTEAEKEYVLEKAEGGLALKEKPVKTPLTVQTEPTGKADLTYNGGEQALVNEGTAPEHGKMQYSLDYESPEAQGTWSDIPPTGKNAGEYKVYYKAVPNTEEDKAKYDDSAVGGPIQVTIAKAKPTFPEDAKTVNGGVYKDNMKLSDVTEPEVAGGTVEWVAPDTPLNAGENQVQAKFTSDDTTNYEGTAEETVKVNVEKATISSEAYTISGEGTFTAGTGARTLTVTAEGFTVEYAEGDYSDSEPDAWLETCPSYSDEEGEHKITVKLSKENYNDLKVVKTITITAKQVLDLELNAKSGLVYNGSPQELVEWKDGKAPTDGDTVNYYVSEASGAYDGEGSSVIPTEENAGTYYVKVTVDRDGYEQYLKADIEVTIAKADIPASEYTITPDSGEADGTEYGVTVTTNAEDLTVKYADGNYPDGEGVDSWQDDSPKFTTAGEHKVTVKITKGSDGNYNDVIKVVTVSVTEPAVTYTAELDTSLTGKATVMADVTNVTETGVVKGTSVTVTVTDTTNFVKNSLTVSYASGDNTFAVPVTAGEGNTYTFAMPEGNVTISALYDTEGTTIIADNDMSYHTDGAAADGHYVRYQEGKTEDPTSIVLGFDLSSVDLADKSVKLVMTQTGTAGFNKNTKIAVLSTDPWAGGSFTAPTDVGTDAADGNDATNENVGDNINKHTFTLDTSTISAGGKLYLKVYVPTQGTAGGNDYFAIPGAYELLKTEKGAYKPEYLPQLVITDKHYVAQIPAESGEGTKYETFEAAVKAAQSGDTIKLLEDVTTENRFIFDDATTGGDHYKSNITIDGTKDGGKYTITKTGTAKTLLFEVPNDKTLSLKNIKLTGGKYYTINASGSNTVVNMENAEVESIRFGNTVGKIKIDSNSKIGTIKLNNSAPTDDKLPLILAYKSGADNLTPEQITEVVVWNSSASTDGDNLIGEGGQYELAVDESGNIVLKKKVTQLTVTTEPTGKADLVYSGEEQPLLENNGEASTGGKIVYSTDYGTAAESANWSEEIPTGTDAKDYTVYYKAVAADTEQAAKYLESAVGEPITVTIAKAKIKDSEVTISQTVFKHDGLAHGITATTTTGSDTVQYAVGEITAGTDIGSVEWQTSCPTYSDIGNHKVTVKVTRNDNYEVYYKTVIITISNDEVIDPALVTITKASGLIYSGAAQELITDVQVEGLTDCTVTYNVVKSGEEGTDTYTNKAEATDAGTYNVTVKITKIGYNEYVSDVQTVEIAKAPSTFPTNLPEVKADYVEGMTLAQVTPPTTTEGTIAWKNPSTEVTEGTHTYEAVFTPTDSDNYNTAEGQVTVNATEKAAPTPTPVEESPSTLTADVVAQLRAMDETWTARNDSSTKFITEGDSNENKIETTAHNNFGVFYSFGAVSLPAGATVTKATLSVYQGETKFSGKPFVVKKTANPEDISKIEDVFNAAAAVKTSDTSIGKTETTVIDPTTNTRTESVDVTDYFTVGERNSYLLYNADATDNNRQLSRKAELVIEFTTSAPEDNYVAEVIPAEGGAGNKYETFKDAIAAVQEGGTIKLLDDITIDRMIFGSTPYSAETAQDRCNINNVTIDGDSHTITSDNSKDMLFEADNRTLTFKNVTLAGGKEYTINAKNRAVIHLQGVTITPTQDKYGVNFDSDQATLYADAQTVINGIHLKVDAPEAGNVIVNKEVGSDNLTTAVAGTFTYGTTKPYTPGTLEVDNDGNLAVSAPAQQLTVTTVPTAKNDLVYNGNEQPLVNEGTASTGGKIVYSLTGTGEWQDTVPTGTDADTYTVYYKAVAADDADADKYIESEVGQVEVTIAKADIPPTAYTITGDGQSKVGTGARTLTVTAEGFTVQYAEGDYSASDPDAWLETCPSYDGSTAGVHTITVKLSNKNYNDLKVVRTITITEKDVLDLELNAKTGLVYTGEPLALVEWADGKAPIDGDTVNYYVSATMGTYEGVGSSEIPTEINAGTYYVKVTVDRGEGYEQYVQADIAVTIAKADITGITVTGYTGDVDGEEHGVTINGDTTGYTVQYKIDGEYSETAPTFKEAGEYTVTVKISRDNYNDLELTVTVTLNEVTEPTPEPDYDFDVNYEPAAPSGPTVYDEDTALEGWFSNNTDTAVTDHVVKTEDGKLVMENNKAGETVPSLWVGTQYAEVSEAAAADRITITFEYTPGSVNSRIYFVSANSDEISNGVDGSTEGIYRTAGGANGLGMTPGMTYDITLEIDNSTHTGQFTVIPKGGVGISLMSVLEPTDLPDGTNAVVFRPAAGATDTIDNFSAELMTTSIEITSVTQAESGYKASITATAADGAAVIAAVYRNGACVQVKFVSGGDVTFENAQSGDVIKAFLWESVESMKPLAAPAQSTIA